MIVDQQEDCVLPEACADECDTTSIEPPKGTCFRVTDEPELASHSAEAPTTGPTTCSDDAQPCCTADAWSLSAPDTTNVMMERQPSDNCCAAAAAAAPAENNTKMQQNDCTTEFTDSTQPHCGGEAPEARHAGKRCNRVDVDENKFVMDEPRRPLMSAAPALGKATCESRKAGLPKLVKNTSSGKAVKQRNPGSAPRPTPFNMTPASGSRFARDEELDFGLAPNDPVAQITGSETQGAAPQRQSGLADLKASVGKLGRNLKGLLRTMSDRAGVSGAQRP